MELSLTFFALAIPATLFAGISKGGFGSGAAFAAAPLLALVLDPGDAIGVMLPLLMMMDVAALRSYWRKWDGQAARLLILGSLPGVALAALIYRLADPDLIRLLIGAVAVGFVAFQVSRQRGWLRLGALPNGTRPGLFWGSLAGFTSFISHAGGPPAAVYLLSRDIDKLRYQATTVCTFWAINLFKVLPYFALGIFTPTSLTADLWLAPVALAGVWVGIVLHHRIPEIWFFRVTYLLLTLTGSKLIWDALT